MVRTLLKRGAVTGVAVIGIEAAYAVLRPSPELESFDPTAEFGRPTDPALRVAVLGDSSVTAPGVSGPDEIWVSLVCERLAADRHVMLQSFAVGGSMAHDVIADQLEYAIDSRPDLVFLSVGANDVIKGVPRSRFAVNLDHLVSELAATGATVVQSGVGVMGSVPRLYPPLSTLMSRRAERFDEVHWEVAAIHGTHVVDQRSDDTEVWFRDRSLWAEDLFHVSAAGHARWAETAWRTVGPLFDRPGGPA
ncbi:MAG: SGNH/GDSL hydrolase family protein [Acidimicrobiia bacterium]|jgi:lysophospholipase L1-like esterase